MVNSRQTTGTTMSLYSPPPAVHDPSRDKPTLLVCWWITLFCATIILLRVAGRFIRSERLFREDKTAALAIIPLFLRMGCVHLILSYGTNNTHFPDHMLPLSDDEMRRRTIGSGLVLASRIFYTATYVATRMPSCYFGDADNSCSYFPMVSSDGIAN